MPVILIGSKPSPEMEKSLSDALEGTEVRYLPEGGKQVDHLEGVEVLYGRIREEEFQTATDLKWVHQPFAGVEGHMFPDFKQSDVMLTNCAGLGGQQISEHAFALLFSLTRRILDQHDFMKQKHWEILPCFEMAGGTMGIVGLGGIGRAIARRARAFEMKVLVVDPEPIQKPDYVDRLEKPDWLGEMMSRSDVVVSCSPSTPETHRLISADAIGRMKKGSYFINISRGKVVDEEALIEALRSGKLAGAGLDVTYQEPCPKENPLWDFPNVILTSHSAGQSQRYRQRAIQLFIDNLHRFVKGEPLANIVDKEKGY